MTWFQGYAVIILLACIFFRMTGAHGPWDILAGTAVGVLVNLAEIMHNKGTAK